MSNRRESSVGAVILAAGGSRRLGRAKQLVVHEGEPLIVRSINAAIDAGVGTIVVVLGATSAEVRSVLPQLPAHVHIAVNDHWEEGMGTSISFGMRTLRSLQPDVTGALILVCDQPALDAKIVIEFLERASAEPGRIFLADYGDSRGPPVFFPRGFLGELEALRGDAGAREIHRRHADAVKTVSFPGGATDIDTPDDLRRVRD